MHDVITFKGQNQENIVYTDGRCTYSSRFLYCS